MTCDIVSSPPMHTFLITSTYCSAPDWFSWIRMQKHIPEFENILFTYCGYNRQEEVVTFVLLPYDANLGLTKSKKVDALMIISSRRVASSMMRLDKGNWVSSDKDLWRKNRPTKTGFRHKLQRKPPSRSTSCRSSHSKPSRPIQASTIKSWS